MYWFRKQECTDILRHLSLFYRVPQLTIVVFSQPSLTMHLYLNVIIMFNAFQCTLERGDPYIDSDQQSAEPAQGNLCSLCFLLNKTQVLTRYN